MGKVLCSDEHFVWGSRVNLYQYELKKVSAFWHLFACYNLCPTSNASEVSKEKANIVFASVKDKPINFGKQVVSCIENSACSTRIDKKLVFPMFINSMCKAYGVGKMDGDKLIPYRVKFCEKLVNVMSCKGNGGICDTLRLLSHHLELSQSTT